MDIQRISVLGAGTMGHGIAQVAAQSGYRTTLYDIEQTLTQAGLDRITANLDKGIARGKVTEDERLNTLGNLSTTTDLKDAAELTEPERHAEAERFLAAAGAVIEWGGDLY